MLESILFMLLMLTGIITLIISLIVILIGIAKKKKQLRKIGLGIAIIPFFCFGLIAFFYGVILPNSHKNQQLHFAGVYNIDESSTSILNNNGNTNTNNQLILEANGSYTFDSIPGINLTSKGLWKTGGIDGHFIFFDQNGHQLDFVFPAESGENCILIFDYIPNKDDFLKREQVRFKKIN